jgi:hypothetical protein
MQNRTMGGGSLTYRETKLNNQISDKLPSNKTSFLKQ